MKLLSSKRAGRVEWWGQKPDLETWGRRVPGQDQELVSTFVLEIEMTRDVLFIQRVTLEPPVPPPTLCLLMFLSPSLTSWYSWYWWVIYTVLSSVFLIIHRKASRDTQYIQRKKKKRESITMNCFKAWKCLNKRPYISAPEFSLESNHLTGPTLFTLEAFHPRAIQYQSLELSFYLLIT